MELSKFEEINSSSDHLPNADPDEPHQAIDSLLGIFGETGSLLSLFKKKHRDAAGFKHFDEKLAEEIGDILWYLTNVGIREHISLTDIAFKAFPELEETVVERSKVSFRDIDSLRRTRAFVSNKDLFSCLSGLSRITGRTVADRLEDHDQRTPALLSSLASVLRNIFALTEVTDISLEKCVHKNISKTLDRWPITKAHPALFDAGFDHDEQLPRQFEVYFTEKTVSGKTFVIQTMNGVHIGDRLTDNIIESDDYRFHDVFHWAYATILGWSPVIRSLLRCKRKSKPEIDEVEDGARARIIEEAISVWVFHQAKNHGYFKNVTSIDFNILKSIRELVSGYEVDSVPYWLWERAIKEGFWAFRNLSRNRGGIITGNLMTREIDYRRI